MADSPAPEAALLARPPAPRAPRAARLRRLTERRACLGCLGCGLTLALAMVFVLPAVIRSTVRQGIRGDVVIDSTKADGFKQFANRGTDGKNSIEFFFFNIKNPEDVLAGRPPEVEELGPWVYDSYQVRGEFDWHPDNDSLAYREHSYFVFNAAETAERTHGLITHDRVPITTLNLLFYGMKPLIGRAYWHLVCDILLWNSDSKRLFANRTVHEYITGYTVEINLLGFRIPIAFPGLYPNVSRSEDPNWTHKSVMRVGAHDIAQTYEMTTWQGMSSVEIKCPWGSLNVPFAAYCPSKFPCCGNKRVPVWGTARNESVWDVDANLVHGRNGEQFAPGVKRGDELVIFNDIIWRALRFQNTDKEEVWFKGIKMLRFTPVSTTFMNASEHPSNARYYQFGPRGLFGNLTMIEQGVPLFASLPHFLHGDPRLRQGVKGLAPNKELHQMHIDVEPILGQTMVEHVRAQVNGQLISGENWGWDSWFPHVKNGTYVPIAWFDMISEISDAGADEFKQIYTAHTAEQILSWFGAVLALVCSALLALAVHTRYYYRDGFEDLDDAQSYASDDDTDSADRVQLA